MVMSEIRFYLSEIEKIVDIVESKNDLQLYNQTIAELKATLTHLEIDLQEYNKLK